jgi:hypothetical protein
MSHALATSSNVPLLETIESIICTATSDPEFGADGVANFTQAKLLDELGFSALVRGGLDDMSRETKMKAAEAAGEITASILSVWKGQSSISAG